MYLQRANSHGESWGDIFAKCAMDFKLHGSWALEIIYSNDRTRLEAYHIDFSFVRAEEKDHPHALCLSSMSFCFVSLFSHHPTPSSKLAP